MGLSTNNVNRGRAITGPGSLIHAKDDDLLAIRELIYDNERRRSDSAKMRPMTRSAARGCAANVRTDTDDMIERFKREAYLHTRRGLRRQRRARPGSRRANCTAGSLLSAQFILNPLSSTTLPHLAVSAVTKSLNSSEVLLMA
jgi:hypothetical protein